MIKKTINRTNLSIFEKMLGQIEWELKVNRNRYYFMIERSKEIGEDVPNEIYTKWQKLERYFDMFYSIRMNLSEIIKLAKEGK